jgi:predicted molibdopterin-dependent oxidoreductase YjgC
MVKLNIDGKEIEAREGATILEAARDNGIHIPTLCYHANLLSIESCRICIVEVAGYDTPMVSCATPAKDGMSVTTTSDKLFAMRQEYLKFILAYHPLDCPICDAGGECDLQNLVVEHKIEKAEFSVERPHKNDVYATPLIKHFDNRCVLCMRCIHACREISGRGVLDLVDSGIDARMKPTNPRNCISCGECLSVCPVGALTENLSHLKSRPWQIERHRTTCPHCGFGCTFDVDLFNGTTVTDIIQDESCLPNNGSLCVLGRFGYDYVNHEATIKEPSIKGAVSPLAEAVSVAANKLRDLDKQGKALGFIVSPRATNEEIYLVKEIAERFTKSTVSTSGFYHTGRVRNMMKRLGIPASYNYDSLLDADLILVAGANLLSNNHVMGDKIRQAVKLKGAKVVVVDPSPTALTSIADLHVKVQPARDAFLFNGVSRRLIEDAQHPTQNEVLEGFVCYFSALKPLEVDAAIEQAGIDRDVFDKFFGLIRRANRMAVIVGSGVGASYESLKGLLNLCVLKGIDKNGLVMPVAREANGLGAVTILDAKKTPRSIMEDDAVKGLFFYEEDPFHQGNVDVLTDVLKGKEFILAADILPTAITDMADMVIPTGHFIDKQGTFIAQDGNSREVNKVTNGRTWTGFQFLTDLLVELGGPRYDDSRKVTEKLNESGIVSTWSSAGKGESKAGKFDAQPIPESLPPTDGFLLILRDVCLNHHIIDKEVYSKGISKVYQNTGYPITEDKLYMSPEDAGALGIGEGTTIEVESKNGLIRKPVSIKNGLRQGVLEYILFKDRQQALKLSTSPKKWIEVKVRKG